MGDTLGQYCESTSIDTVTLAFVNNSPENAGGYPGTNFAAHCAAAVYAKDGVDTKLLSGCSFIKEDLQKCRKLGKKIVLSIGGEYSEFSDYSLSSVKAGQEFAHYMFDMFGPVQEGYSGPRPFDLSQEETFCVDGFDFDIETKFADQAPYVAMVQKLRYLISTVPEKMILTAAPQCPLDPKYFQMDTILAKAQFDRISVQFYNNPSCDGRSSGFNYDAWVSWLSNTVNKNAEIFVGLPGSEGAAPAGGYLKPKEATDLICKYKKKTNFGGVMIWDAYLSTQNKDCRPGETFYDVVADALKCGGACGENILFCPKPPVTTTSSSAVSTSTSSTISTSSSASTAVTTTSSTSTSSSVPSSTSSAVFSTSSVETSSTSSAETTTSTSSAETSTASSAETSSTSSVVSLTSSAETSTTSSAKSSATSSVGTSTSSGVSSSQTSINSVPATTSSSASSPITSPATSSTATSSSATVSSSTTEEDECEEETYSASVPVPTSSTSITLTASTSAVTSSATASSSTTSEDDCEEETTSASVPASTLSASTTSAPATSKPTASVTSAVPVTYPASQPESSSATGPATTQYSTSTIYTTKVHTVTACPPEVTNCPLGEKTTEVIPVYTTVCPVTSEKAVPTYPAGGNGDHGSPSAPAPVPTYPAGEKGSPSAPAPVPTYPGGEKGSPSAPAPVPTYPAGEKGSPSTPAPAATYPAGGHGGSDSPSAPAGSYSAATPGSAIPTYPAGGKGEHGDNSGYPSSPAGSYPAATPGTETTKNPAVPTYPVVVANYPVVSTLTKVVPVYPTAAHGNNTIPGTGTGYPVGPSPTKGSGHGGNSPAASSTTAGYPVTTAPVTAGSAKMMVSLGALFAVVLAF